MTATFKIYFHPYGQSGISPCQLALICIMQFLEDLKDRQAAEAIHCRIDWKYLLSLELTDSGLTIQYYLSSDCA